MAQPLQQRLPDPPAGVSSRNAKTFVVAQRPRQDPPQLAIMGFPNLGAFHGQHAKGGHG
jgi:hypothetical protein